MEILTRGISAPAFTVEISIRMRKRATFSRGTCGFPPRERSPDTPDVDVDPPCGHTGTAPHIPRNRVNYTKEINYFMLPLL